MISYDGLYALVRELDGGLNHMTSAGRQAADTHQDHPIPGNLGTVTVTGAGQLVSISLDARMLPYVNGHALGATLTRAINDAEHKAAARWRQHVDAARPRFL